MISRRRYNSNWEDELFRAIKECKKVAENSSKDAYKILDFIKTSIIVANKNLDLSINEISKQKVRDAEMVITLTEQLTKIKTTFIDEYDDVKRLVDRKVSEANEFNITLFGRTKVGKSTLMEILTNGNGSSIGKGGQRTTLNVRKYKWKGLTIIDVPGFDAFQGDADERIAYEAAKSADIIMFMISDGQPEATEAEWLVRLKREDKPIICICNAKRTLDDELDMEMFLDNPNEILDDRSIHEIIDQFNDFVKDKLPNEHIEIKIAQLQARYLANKKEYASKRLALIKASRFGSIEREIVKIVINNGVSFRRKCFFSIIDIPLYNQYLELFENSSIAYHQYRIAKEKVNEFCEWQKDFVVEERTSLLNKIEQIFDNIISTVPNFVEDNIEKENFKILWEKHLNSFNVDAKTQNCYNVSVKKAENKINQLFAAFEKELMLKSKLLKDIKFHTYGTKIHDWKKTWQWSSCVAGVFSAIAVLVNVPVVGWIAGAAVLMFGIFSWLSDSRENKLRKARVETENKLRYSLNKSKIATKDNVYKAFQSNIVSGLLTDSYGRLRVIETTLLTLANSQRELGLKYLKHHSDISKSIILSALYDLGVEGLVLDHIDFVARIPGKKTIIGSSDKIVTSYSSKISEKLGNKEEVRVFRKSLSGNIYDKLRVLCCYFHLNVPMKVKTINNDGFNQNIVYVDINKNYSEEDNINLFLLQQILNVHIIRR